MEYTKRNRNLRCAAAALVCLLLCLLCAVPVQAAEGGLYRLPEDFTLQAGGVILINANSGAVVYEKNADDQFVCASLVKMMTCILAMENVADLDAPTMEARGWIYDELYGKNASHADIRKGEVLTMRELLYAMLLPSANEAALITADFISGQYYQNFIYMMNQKAAALGCTNTVFADPNGLSEENLTTPRDMALILQAFVSYPELVEIAATPVYEMAAHNHEAPYNILTTNRLLVESDPYARAFPKVRGAVKAGKTGSLGEWQNFASMAEVDGESYYCVVMNSPNAADATAGEGATRFRPALYETAALYNWVFTNYEVQPALDVERPITEIRVKYSTKQDSVRLLPESNLATVLPVDGSQEIEKVFALPQFLEAPVAKGDRVGTVALLIDGTPIGEVDLIVSQDVERNPTLYIMEQVKGFFGSTLFKVLLMLVVVAVVLYIGLVMQAGRRRQRERDVVAQPPPQNRQAGRPPGGKAGQRAPTKNKPRGGPTGRRARHDKTQGEEAFPDE